MTQLTVRQKLIVELENKENKLINNSQADLQYMFDLLQIRGKYMEIAVKAQF